MTWFILLHQWERTALKRHKNNIENNKPGFLEIKAELKADLPAQPDWLMGGTTICCNWLLCLSPSCHLGLCKIEGKKKKKQKKAFYLNFLSSAHFQGELLGSSTKCEERRGCKERMSQIRNVMASLGPCQFFSPPAVCSWLEHCQRAERVGYSPGHIGLQHL